MEGYVDVSEDLLGVSHAGDVFEEEARGRRLPWRHVWGQEECERSKLLNGAASAAERTGFSNKGVSSAVLLLGLLWAFISSKILRISFMVLLD